MSTESSHRSQPFRKRHAGLGPTRLLCLGLNALCFPHHQCHVGDTVAVVAEIPAVQLPSFFLGSVQLVFEIFDIGKCNSFKSFVTVANGVHSSLLVFTLISRKLFTALRSSPKKLDHEPMLILVRTAKPVKGQSDGQETAATHSGIRVPTIARPQHGISCRMAADRPWPIRARHISLNAPYLSRFVVLTFGPAIPVQLPDEGGVAEVRFWVDLPICRQRIMQIKIVA